MSEFFKSVDSWIWIVVILVIYMAFYIFRNISSYNKNRNAILEFQNSLQVGSRVVLSSGIHATIKELTRQTAVVEIAPKIEILVERFSIATLEKTVLLEDNTEEENKE